MEIVIHFEHKNKNNNNDSNIKNNINKIIHCSDGVLM